ncbi:hypothetical protein ACIGO9_28465 [Nocardia asteroides]|uniref:hypothetical protein n=1 Tax=Nocardia asteroides TaxID=1824 RepID=UPI0037C5F92E
MTSGLMTTGMISAEPSREHLEFLLSNGCTRKRISIDSGVARQTIIMILQGRKKKVVHHTHRALLKIQPARPERPAGYVDAIGSRRRAQSLIASGHTLPYVAARAGLSMRALCELVNGVTIWVDPITATKLDRTFRLMQLTIGNSAAARRLAASHRWSLPLEWDEEDLDLPGRRPQPSSRQRLREVADAIAAKPRSLWGIA